MTSVTTLRTSSLGNHDFKDFLQRQRSRVQPILSDVACFGVPQHVMEDAVFQGYNSSKLANRAYRRTVWLFRDRQLLMTSYSCHLKQKRWLVPMFCLTMSFEEVIRAIADAESVWRGRDFVPSTAGVCSLLRRIGSVRCILRTEHSHDCL